VSGAPVRIPFSVLAFQPWLGLSNYTPQPEMSIGVVGHDFAPSEQVAIYFDRAIGVPLAQGQADSKGVARVDPAFQVPYATRGKMVVVAIGTISQIPISTTLTVRPYTPTFELSTYAGPPGSMVSANGKGFGRAEKLSLVLGEGGGTAGATPMVTIVTKADGSFHLTQPFRIPDTASGKQSITIVGEHSVVPVSTTFAVVALAPWITPDPAAGPAGQIIGIDGGGFEPGENVQVATSDVGASASTVVVADKNGAFKRAGSLLIPPTDTGRVSVKAVGTRSGVKATGTYSVIP
jgi:hypothetical protein